MPKLRGSVSYKPIGSQNNWEVELADIRILDKTKVFAVGRQKRKDEPGYPVLLGTSDGGKTWRKMLVGRDTSMYFSSVQFINAQIGWIVGARLSGDGLILKSTDGGMTWIKQRTPVESAFSVVRMIDQQSGWVMSKDGELLHTSDGGNSWTSHRLKGHGWVRSNTSGRAEFRGWLTSFYFGDSHNGWVVGNQGKAYQSTDGGVSWKSRGPSLIRNIPGWKKLEIDLQAVKFLSPKIGFIEVTVTPKDVPDPLSKGLLLKTVDGGVTWASTVVTGASLLGVEILNEKEMWALPGIPNRLLHTKDGGKTWSTFNVPDREGETVIRGRFLDSQTGWLITNNGMFLDEIRYTVDGGRTWNDSKLVTN